MTQVDFIKKVLGKPWVDRAISLEYMDCWGLVVLYYKHVLNINLVSSDSYVSGGDFIVCHENILWQWVKKDHGSVGDMITFYNGNNPNHVGVYLGCGKVLHSRGEGGSVKIDRLAAMMKIYSKAEFREYATL